MSHHLGLAALQWEKMTGLLVQGIENKVPEVFFPSCQKRRVLTPANRITQQYICWFQTPVAYTLLMLKYVGRENYSVNKVTYIYNMT